MMHRFESLEGSMARILDSVQGTLLVEQNYIENYISS
jgi:hypothetical protein